MWHSSDISSYIVLILLLKFGWLDDLHGYNIKSYIIYE
jgi:hypothetical protein